MGAKPMLYDVSDSPRPDVSASRLMHPAMAASNGRFARGPLLVLGPHLGDRWTWLFVNLRLGAG